MTEIFRDRDTIIDAISSIEYNPDIAGHRSDFKERLAERYLRVSDGCSYTISYL